MRGLTLLRESAVSALAAKVPTLLIVLVTAAMCFATSAIAGRNASLQLQIERRTQDAGARVITISDLGEDGFLTATALDTIGTLSTVEGAAAVTRPVAVTNATLGWGGPTVNAWGFVADAPANVELVRGRWPMPGEALISAEAAATLRFETGAGAVVTRDALDYPVVGTFEATAPFDWLNSGVVFVPRGQQVGKEARVSVDELGALGVTERAIRAILKPNDPSKLSITSPKALADVSREVGGDVRSAGYDTTVLVLIVGALFVAAVTLADVLIRRRDLGRRRTLGITRFDLLALICLRSSAATMVGAALGIVAVQAYGLLVDARPPLLHTVASAVLVILTALVATIPVGLVAARRDPVSVLRTP